MLKKHLMRSVILGAVGFAAATTASPVFAQATTPAPDPQAPPTAQAPSEATPPPAATPPAPSPPPAAAAPPPASAPPPAAAAPASDAPRTAFATTNLNLRGGPGTDAPILATIPAGSSVRITSCSGEWCAVQWNGRDGYAIASNLGSQRPRIVRRYSAQPYYEAPPPVVYGPPVYYSPPPVYYRPYYRPYYYGPRYYYGHRWRRW